MGNALRGWLNFVVVYKERAALFAEVCGRSDISTASKALRAWAALVKKRRREHEAGAAVADAVARRLRARVAAALSAALSPQAGCLSTPPPGLPPDVPRGDFVVARFLRRSRVGLP